MTTPANPLRLQAIDRVVAVLQGILAGDLILNGGFGSDAGSWTPADCTLASIAGGVSGNCLQLTRTAAASQSATQTVGGLTIGQSYEFSAWVKSGTAGDKAGQLVVNDGTGAELYTTSFTSSGTWTRYSVIFTAISHTSFDFSLVKNNATAGTMLFDSASLQEVPPTAAYWYRPYVVNKRFTHWAECKGFPTYSVSAGTTGGDIAHASEHEHYENFPLSVKAIIHDNVDTVTKLERALADVRKAVMIDACGTAAGSLGVLCVDVNIHEPPDTDDGLLVIEGGFGFFEQIFWIKVASTYGEI